MTKADKKLADAAMKFVDALEYATKPQHEAAIEKLEDISSDFAVNACRRHTATTVLKLLKAELTRF